MLIKQLKAAVLLPLLMIGLFFLNGCTPQAKISVYTAAEIETKGIKKVAIGRFEIAEIYEKIKVERNGTWSTKTIPLSTAEKKSISNQIRSQVVNTIAANPYFDLVYTDEFAKLENDTALQQLISASGYKSKNVDAVINGKIWLDFEKTDGAEVAKTEMLYVKGGKKSRRSLNISVEKILWWPYKASRGTLILEAKLTKLDPTEILAITVDSRRFSHKIGGKPKGLTESIGEIGGTFSNIIEDKQADKQLDLEKSNMVLPSFQQVTSDLAKSIATNFVRRVAVTKQMKSYPIAQGGNSKGALLIEVGAYDRAIDTLQQSAPHDKEGVDYYNLGLAFEAIGEYGTAINFYKRAFSIDKENLMFTQGLGRIERLLRERPALRRQLEEK